MRGVLAGGGSEEDAVRWMEIEGQGAANLAPSIRPFNPSQPQEVAEAEEIGMINGLGRRALQGISFGFGDEALGSILGLVSGIGARGGIERYRAEMDAWSEEHGKLGFAAEMIGALATGFGVAKGVGALFGRGLSAAEAVRKTSTAGAVLRGTAIGAAEGTVAGAGFAEGDLSDRAKAALFGTGIGGVFGGTLTAGGRGLGAILRPATQATTEALPPGMIQNSLQRLPGVRGPEQHAREIIARQILEDGTEIPVLRERLLDFAGTGTPVSLADLSGEGTMALVANTIALRSPARQATVEALRTRQADQGGRLTGGILSRIFRDSKFGMQTADDVIDTLSLERQKLASPLYDQAHEAAVTLTPRMQQLLNEPKFRDAWEIAARAARNEDIAFDAIQGLEVPNLPPRIPQDLLEAGFSPPGGGLPASLPVRGFNLMKQSLDDIIDSSKRGDKPIGNKEASSLRRALNNVLDEVDEQVPVYGQARLAWSGPSQAIGNVEMGVKRFAGKTPTPGAIRRELRDVFPADRDFYRLGAIQSIYDKMSSSSSAASRFFGGRLFGSIEPPEAQAIRALFPDAPEVANDFMRRVAAEARVTETTLRTRVTSGARALSVQAIEASTEGAIPSVRASTGLTVAGALRDALVRSKGGFSAATADEIAVMFMQGLDDPAQLSHLLDVLQLTQERLIREGRRGSTAAAISGFLAGKGVGEVQSNLAN